MVDNENNGIQMQTHTAIIQRKKERTKDQFIFNGDWLSKLRERNHSEQNTSEYTSVSVFVDETYTMQRRLYMSYNCGCTLIDEIFFSYTSLLLKRLVTGVGIEFSTRVVNNSPWVYRQYCRTFSSEDTENVYINILTTVFKSTQSRFSNISIL